MKASQPLRCSFCGKSQDHVRKLIAGPTVYICDECVELCNDIIAAEWEKERQREADEAPAEDAEGPGAASLEVRHTPLSREDVPLEFIRQLQQDAYRYVRFYRTSVTNHTDRPVRIVWFDAFQSFDGDWTASNVRNQVLRTRDFIDWYGGDGVVPGGWLQPGATASDSVNWHATDTREEVPTKWAYLAVDAEGNDYFVEALVPATEAEHLSSPPARGDERRGPSRQRRTEM